MKRALIMMLGVVTGLTGCMGESYLFDEEFGGDSGSLWHTGMDSGDSGQIEDPPAGRPRPPPPAAPRPGCQLRPCWAGAPLPEPPSTPASWTQGRKN